MAVRDEKGRFVKGHSGNPKGRSTHMREERYYEIAMNTVTFEDWKDIIRAAIKQAKRGDTQARKWLSDYLAPIAQRHDVNVSDGPSWKDFIYDDTDTEPGGE